jgi:hypothetical protein
MVLGSETDQHISEFQLRALIREGDFLGRQVDNTPSLTYGRRAVPALAALQIKSSLADRYAGFWERNDPYFSRQTWRT